MRVLLCLAEPCLSSVILNKRFWDSWVRTLLVKVAGAALCSLQPQNAICVPAGVLYQKLFATLHFQQINSGWQKHLPPPCLLPVWKYHSFSHRVFLAPKWQKTSHSSSQWCCFPPILFFPPIYFSSHSVYLQVLFVNPLVMDTCFAWFAVQTGNIFQGVTGKPPAYVPAATWQRGRLHCKKGTARVKSLWSWEMLWVSSMGCVDRVIYSTGGDRDTLRKTGAFLQLEIRVKPSRSWRKGFSWGPGRGCVSFFSTYRCWTIKQSWRKKMSISLPLAFSSRRSTICFQASSLRSPHTIHLSISI